MKTLEQIALTLSLSLFAVVPAFAFHAEPYRNHSTASLERSEPQHQRIHQGHKHKQHTRQYTRKEARVRMRQQREIRQLTRLFIEDGRISKHER